jgi:NitT/TauT family transport system substrate-binding protein
VLIFLPAYLKAIGLQPTDITVNNVDCGSITPLFVAGKADLITGFTPGSLSNLTRAGLTNVSHLDYADAGIVLPSTSIVASTKAIETNPGLVRRFVAATRRGWEEALKDPAAAVAIELRSFPALQGQDKVFAAELKGYGDYTSTPNTAGKPFGWQSPDDWKAAEKIMVEYMEMKPLASTDGYYTNEFIAP